MIIIPSCEVYTLVRMFNLCDSLFLIELSIVPWQLTHFKTCIHSRGLKQVKCHLVEDGRRTQLLTLDVHYYSVLASIT